MSSADRRRVGRVASALAAGETRSAILSRRLAGTLRTAAAVASLEKAPDWLCREPAERRQLGYRAALAGLGPALAASIDGRWLGGLAAVAGEDALDWASAQRDVVAALPMFDGGELDGIASGLLRAAAPADLADFAAPSGQSKPADTGVAIRLIEAAG